MMQGFTNCEILQCRIGEHGENWENMEKMENIMLGQLKIGEHQA